MFGLSGSFTSWAVRRALTARGAGVAGDRWTQNGWQQQQLDGGWRTLSRAPAKPNHRRAECTMGRPVDPPCSLRAWATREQRAPQQSAALWLGTASVSWERNKKSFPRISPPLEFDFGLCVWLLRERVTASNQPFLLCCSARKQIKWSDLVDLPRPRRWSPVCRRRPCWCVCCDDVKGVVAGSGYLVAGVSILSRPPPKWQNDKPLMWYTSKEFIMIP